MSIKNMEKKAQYEKRILREIQSLPDEALPKVIRLLSLINEEFVAEKPPVKYPDDEVNHKTTRELLGSSKRNWAQDVVSDRADRI